MVRQLALKVLTGFVALIPASYGPEHVRVLAPSLQMRDAVVTVCMEVLSLQVQYSNVRRTVSRLTGSFGDQHNPAVLSYLDLKTLQMAGYVRSTILIRLDAFSFPLTDGQRPLLEPCGSQSVPIGSIERPVVAPSFVYAE